MTTTKKRERYTPRQRQVMSLLTDIVPNTHAQEVAATLDMRLADAERTLETLTERGVLARSSENGQARWRLAARPDAEQREVLERHRNRRSGTTITTLKLTAPPAAGDGGPAVTYGRLCEEHGTLQRFETRTEMERGAWDPRPWCARCGR